MSQPQPPAIPNAFAMALPAIRAGKALQRALPVAPVAPRNTDAQKSNNPFMVALNPSSQEFKDSYGINRPLNKPMFLGYKDEQALYGGSRLFILY